MAEPLALYVHIPFCDAKCTYCDFNSYAGQGSLMAPYAQAVAAEAALWAPVMTGRRFETVFFGGGTPSILPLGPMATIVAALRQRFDIAPGAEMSLEANPGTVDAAHLQGLHDLGFNRISFGVQSFHDAELRQLERIHDAEEVKSAYRWAREAGFANVNLDLIYGLIGQDMPSWQTNLETALALAPDHLSLYALTIEDGTPLARDIARGRSPGPDLDLQADMFEWSRARMATAGYQHYEVSNWARLGRECAHNLVYWRNGDWLGLGAGACSHLFDERFTDAATPSRYIELVTGTSPLQRAADAPGTDDAFRLIEHAQDVPAAHKSLRVGETTGAAAIDAMRQVVSRERADRDRELAETVMLGLRLREGIDLAAFRRRYGVTFEDVFAAPLAETQSLGLTELVDGRLRLRDEAVMLGDEAFLRFLPAYGE